MTPPRKPVFLAALALASAAAAISSPGHAAITGGFDPIDTMSVFGTWMVTVAGFVIFTLIFMIRGIQLGFAGRQALSHLGYAAAGVVIFYGSVFFLTYAGIA